jgi:large subunit ribosomal protein L18
MNKLKVKKARLMRRKLRAKRKLKTSMRPRLCITRTNKYIYAQIIDDSKGHTEVFASSLEKDFPVAKRCNIAAATALGKILAERSQKKGIKTVVFDRNGRLYHGRVKAFAESARKNGLEF